MNALVALALTGVLLVGSLALIKASAQVSLRTDLVAYRLRFPRNLDPEAVTGVLAGLSGLLLPWWRRWLASPLVSLEIHASQAGINHFLVVSKRWSRSVENIFQASVPAVRFEVADLPKMTVRTAAEYRLTDHNRLLLVDAAGISGRLLTSLQPLEAGETLVVQWVITPHGPVPPIPNAGSQSQDSTPLILGTGFDSEAMAAIRKKQAAPLLLATSRIGVRARTGWAELRLLRQAEAAWHETRAPGVHLRRRMVTASWVARSMQLRRGSFSAWPGTYNVEELTGLIGWPIKQLAIPGLILGGCRQIPASPLLPRTGTFIADSTYPGDERPLAMDTEARLRHLHLLGPTGTGKSTLIVEMVLSDLREGRGAIVLDPKGDDLVQPILERIPDERRGDVIVFNPADTHRPVGLNPLRAANGTSAEVVVENLVGLFKSLYRHSWGPRLDDILRAALLTLAGAGGTTLCEVPLILTDPNYRRRLVGRLDDPVGLESFWGWYEGLSDAEKLTVVGPVMNKVRAFTMRPTVRSIIGQSEPALSMSEVLRSGKVLLCSLASGLLGEEAASLLGALIVAELWHATTARAGQPAENRRPVMAYLDEWQHFVHLPTPMPSMLAEARGMKLGMTLAHQHLDQLDDEARNAVLANARSRVLFQLPASDARIMERELGGILTADDLQGLGAFEVVCQLFAAGTTLAPATGKTRSLPPAFSDARAIRSSSRDRYGVALDEVEASIRQRQTGRPSGAVGRRARPGSQS